MVTDSPAGIVPSDFVIVSPDNGEDCSSFVFSDSFAETVGEIIELSLPVNSNGKFEAL